MPALWLRCFCISAILGFGLLKSIAQPALHFQNFTQKDGLASNYILSILEDHQGFIWIGTENGLSRFDGKHFLEFRFDPEVPESLTDNWVRTIFEDSQHNLWIGTERGLNRLNRNEGKLERIPLLKSGQPVMDGVKGVLEDPSGNIWLATLKTGLYKLTNTPKEKNNWKAIHYAYQDSPSSQDNRLKIFNLIHATSEELWISTSAGVDRFHFPTKKVKRYEYSDRVTYYEGDLDILPGIYDGTEKIYVGLEGQLYFINIREDLPRLSPLQVESSELKARKFYLRSVLWDSPDELLIPSLKNLILLNVKTRKARFVNGDQKKGEDLFPEFVHVHYKDSKGNYWVGTAGGGLFIGQKTEKAFTFYQNDPTDPNSISRGQVRSLIEDDDGNLWIGILNHGLDQFSYQDNFRLKKTRSIPLTPNPAKPFLSNRVIKIMNGSKQSIWIATLTSGLIRMDKEGSHFQSFTYQKDDPNSLSANRLWGLTMDKAGFIWIGTWTDGLNRLDPKTGLVKTFNHDPNNSNSLGHDNIRYLFIDSKNMLWIGTEGGLVCYDLELDQFTHFEHDPNDSNTLSDNLVWAIYEHQRGELWVGTNTGLNRYNPEGNSFERFFEKHGLPDNTIYGILEDNSGVLWVSTENGLARMVRNDSIVSFLSIGLEDGLETVSFLPKAYLNSSWSDRLYFGSSDGLVAVRPTLLQRKAVQPRLVLNNMTKFSRKAEQGITDNFVTSNNGPVKLGYQDQSITFTLADLNWLNNQSYHYEYQLVGFNNQWMPLEDNMQLTFTNLPPGKYTLQARAKTLENIRSEPVGLLDLKVFPPWWKSWWAYASYMLFTGFFVFALYRFQLHRQLEKQETENLRTLDTFKNKLFTNITHEFRTPLTIILGMTEQIEKKPDQWLEAGIKMIQRNGTNLLDLVNQILELQKVESGNLKVEMHYGDVIPFLRTICDQFQAFAQSKKQEVNFHAEEDELYMDFDSEKVLRIFSNLLSNAIKYTPERGKITCTISTGADTELKSNSCLILTITDTGLGIAETHLPYIFDRFYQASSKQKEAEISSGVGLSLVQELVKLLKGKIEVTSEVDKGSTFRVLLPITKTAEPAQEQDQVYIQSTIFGNKSLKQRKTTQVADLPLALLVEDNPDIAQYLQICLEGKYTIKTTDNGEKGIDTALEYIPDIIVSDVMMPKKDGLELCEALKEDERTSHIPIILLTAKSDVESRIAGLKQGADDYLAKPFHEEELLVRMQNLLNIRRKLQERYQDLYNNPPASTVESLPAKEDAFILKIKQVFESRMNDPQFDLNVLSKELHLSRSQLGRKVKALTGQSPAIFLRSIRLQKARHLLMNSNLSVKEVAYDVGFSDPAYFSRAYSEKYGESPGNTADS